jgi:tRNA dimethylallyltransferase
LWDEFCRLRTAGFRQDSPGLICVGYRELFDVELNRCSLQDAVEAIKYDTRRYAKRQMTWFRNKTPGHPFEVNTQNVRDLIDSYTRFIEGTRT